MAYDALYHRVLRDIVEQHLVHYGFKATNRNINLVLRNKRLMQRIESRAKDQVTFMNEMLMDLPEGFCHTKH